MKNIADLKGSESNSAGTRHIKMESLASLVQPNNFVGWAYYMDYEVARILTNDLWKFKANGIPHNCFLVAASFDPNNENASNDIEREVILLRVTGSTKLPQDDDLVRGRID